MTLNSTVLSKVSSKTDEMKPVLRNKHARMVLAQRKTEACHNGRTVVAFDKAKKGPLRSASVLFLHLASSVSLFNDSFSVH